MVRCGKFKSWKRRDYLIFVSRNAALLFMVGYLFYGSWIGGLACTLLLGFLLKLDYQEFERVRQERLGMEFKEALLSLKSALRAGYAAENAIAETEKDLKVIYGNEGEIVREFRQIRNELRMRVPLERALENFGERTGVEDIRDFAVIVRTAKRSGGDLVAIMDNTAEIIGEKIQVYQDISTVLAAKRLEWNVMTMVPLGIICYMKISFPDFLKVLYGSVSGILIMTIALAAFAGAYAMGRGILRIEV